MLYLKEVSKKLGDTEVLKNCNLVIEEGKIFGLVGINGSGKSTLLRIISGVFESDSGLALYNNQMIYENPLAKKDILFISDDLYYARNATIYDIKKLYQTFYEVDEEKFQKFVELFKLNPNKPINNFSKGMKRQVFIILALSICPKLLLLDEAFDGLDPFARLIFKKAISELIENNQTSIIISSHNLRELEDICDSFGILENGEINTSGNIDDSKEKINKFQLVFEDSKEVDEFSEFEILSWNKNSRVINLVIKGELEEVKEKLKKMNPILLEILPINFEELFIFEMERKGYKLYE